MYGQYLLKLKVKRTSKFDRALETVRAYCSDHWTPPREIKLAAYNPKTRTIDVYFTKYGDMNYLANDLVYNVPAEGVYDRFSAIWAYHITNDPNCQCTPCSEGGLDLLFHGPANRESVLV